MLINENLMYNYCQCSARYLHETRRREIKKKGEIVRFMQKHLHSIHIQQYYLFWAMYYKATSHQTGSFSPRNVCYIVYPIKKVKGKPTNITQPVPVLLVMDGFAMTMRHISIYDKHKLLKEQHNYLFQRSCIAVIMWFNKINSSSCFPLLLLQAL